MEDEPYHKVRDHTSPALFQCIQRVWQWLTHRRRSDQNDERDVLQTPQDVRVRVAKRLKQINLKLVFLEKRADKLEAQGRAYIQNRQPMRAESEAKVYMHIQQKIRVLLNVHTKLRLLVQEMDALNTLAQCMDSLSAGNEALGQQIRDGLHIDQIDDMMTEWDMQMRDADEIGRAMRQQTSSSSSSSSSLRRVQYRDETDASSILMSWRVDALEALDNSPVTSSAGALGVEENKEDDLVYTDNDNNIDVSDTKPLLKSD